MLIRARWARILPRAGLVAALLATVGASVAYAHGSADQSNDPPTDTYFSCGGRSGGFSQGFVPSRRLLSSLDLRMFHGFDERRPRRGERRAREAPTGSVRREREQFGLRYESASSRSSTSTSRRRSRSSRQGTFVIELVTADPGSCGGWAGRTTRTPPRRVTTATRGHSRAHDFNFVTVHAGRRGAPDTTMQGGPLAGSITRESSTELLFAGTDDLSYPSSLVSTCELDGRPYAPCASPLPLSLPDWSAHLRRADGRPGRSGRPEPCHGRLDDRHEAAVAAAGRRAAEARACAGDVPLLGAGRDRPSEPAPVPVLVRQARAQAVCEPHHAAAGKGSSRSARRGRRRSGKRQPDHRREDRQEVAPCSSRRRSAVAPPGRDSRAL